jgi:ABC-2 type transport system ATP-binding protein
MVSTPLGGRIVVSGLTKSFGRVKALDNLSFMVEPGTIAGFLGPNGAGKTTTLRVLLGLVKPDAGTATIDNVPYASLRDPTHHVGAVLDAESFHPARSGRNHLRVYCTVNGFALQRADEVLQMAGLSEVGRRPVRGYSLGMRQRLALATALLGDPSVLVLDEPANGLDPHGIAWLRDLLREFAARGRTILVSSHLLAEVQQLVDYFIIVDEGRLVRQGTLAEIAAERGRAVLVRTTERDRLIELIRAAGASAEPNGPDALRVIGMDTDQIGSLAYRQGIQLRWLAYEPLSLEQIFLDLTEPRLNDDLSVVR